MCFSRPLIQFYIRRVFYFGNSLRLFVFTYFTIIFHENWKNSIGVFFVYLLRNKLIIMKLFSPFFLLNLEVVPGKID